MKEQIPLNFNREHSREELEALPHDELCRLYQEKHGRDIRSRVWSKERIIEGILSSPENERKRVGEEDRASDRDDIKNTYRR